MANSPLLQIPQVAPNQTNKETTINDGFSIMERSLNDIKQIPMAAGNVELNIEDYTRAFLFELSGHTATRTLEVPASTRLFSVFNDGTSTVTIEAKDAGGLTAAIPSGAYCVLFNNGLDIRMISNSQASGQVSAFLSLPDTPNSFEGHAGHALVVNQAEDAITFGTIAVSFTQLTDTPNNYIGQANKALRVNSAASGVTFSDYINRFLQLTDTPGSYVSQAGRMLVVNAMENAVEFSDIPEAKIQATRNFTLTNSSFENGDLTNWIVPTTSGSIWTVDNSYGPLLPYQGSYLCYFGTGQGNEPTSIAYEVDLTEQAYPEELDDEAEFVVEVAIGSTDKCFGIISVDFLDESENLLQSESSPAYEGGLDLTIRRFKMPVPVDSRKAIVYVNVQSNPESFEPDQIDFAIDALSVQLKLTVDQIVNFIQLFDVPHDYAGNANKLLAVKGNETGLEFINKPLNINAFTDLVDTPNVYTSASLRHLRVNSGGTGIEFTTPTFLQLNDTPASFSGSANRVVRVNSGGTALIFTDYRLSTLTDTDFTNSPTEGQTIIYDSVTNRWKPGTAAIFPRYGSNAGKFLAVNSGETSVEWKDIGDAAFPSLTGNSKKVLIVKEDESGVEWSSSGGSATYPDFSDNAGKYLAVNSGEDGVEWKDIGSGTFVEPPNDDKVYGRKFGEWIEVTGGGGSADYPDFEGNAGKVLAVNNDEDDVLWVPQSAGIATTTFGVAFSTIGEPEADKLVFRFISPGIFTLPVGLDGSYGIAGTAPTGNAVNLSIKKNGSEIGLMSFAASATEATFTFTSAVSFAIGDRLEIFAPADVYMIEDVCGTFIGEV